MPDIHRVALWLEYDGRGFEGWQTQAHGRSLQDVVEAQLSRIANARIATVCAGRTDSGVHATVQVLHFETSSERPNSAWIRGVNAGLPSGVAVLWAGRVDQGFHARFSATQRHYRYVLLNRAVRPALLAGRVGWFHQALDVERMKAAAACLLGEQDFSAFRAAGCQARSPVRVLSSLLIQRHGDMVYFDFSANAFLHHMIRNIVGSLVYVGKSRHPPEWLGEVLAGRERSRAAPTFAPDGLYLCGVSYAPQWSLPNDGVIICRPRILLS